VSTDLAVAGKDDDEEMWTDCMDCISWLPLVFEDESSEQQQQQQQQQQRRQPEDYQPVYIQTDTHSVQTDHSAQSVIHSQQLHVVPPAHTSTPHCTQYTQLLLMAVYSPSSNQENSLISALQTASLGCYFRRLVDCFTSKNLTGQWESQAATSPSVHHSQWTVTGVNRRDDFCNRCRDGFSDHRI